MPELPEIETARRGLQERLPGRTITGVELLLPKLFNVGDAATLKGRTVERVRRHAKFLIIEFTDGWDLVFHFNLAGQIIHENPAGVRVSAGHPVPAFDAPLPHKSTRLILQFDDGGTLWITDIRAFTNAWLLPRPEAEAFLESKNRGPDALTADISPAEFQAMLKRRGRTGLKALLLDQSFLAGLGNIYADEALFGARIHPLRTAGSLSEQEATALLNSIHEVLNIAVTEGVAQVLNGRALPGVKLPRVHGREGQPCPVCGTPIQRIQVTQRSTYFCPVDQPAPAPSEAAED